MVQKIRVEEICDKTFAYSYSGNRPIEHTLKTNKQTKTTTHFVALLFHNGLVTTKLRCYSCKREEKCAKKPQSQIKLLAFACILVSPKTTKKKNQQRYTADTALNAGNESYILPNLPQSLTYTCLCFHSMCNFLHRKNSVQQSKPRNEISEHHHTVKKKLSEGKEVDKIILIC